MTSPDPPAGSAEAAADAVRLAVGTLTRWRVPEPRRVDVTRAAGAMLLAPVVGVALGTAGAVLAWVGGWMGLPALAVAALLVAGLALASRGLHLDGLADTADGLGSGRPAPGALEVMRRGDVGPMGVATVVLVLLAQVVLLGQAVLVHGVAVCVVAVAASRLALPWACRRGVPAARPEGLGAAVAGTVPVLGAALVSVATAVLALALLGWAGIAAVVAAVLASLLLTRTVRRRLGGITGDVLGWLVELALLVAVLVLAAPW